MFRIYDRINSLKQVLRSAQRRLIRYLKETRLNEIILRILFLSIIFFLIWTDFKKIGNSIKTSRLHFKKIKNKTLEQIKEDTYARFGYGYIRDIVSRIPEKDIFPITRYPDYTKNVHLYMSEFRNRIDNRLLIGIGLEEKDTHEVIISNAHFRKEPLLEKNVWAFQTIDDFDTMTGLVFYFEEPNLKISIPIKVNLISELPYSQIKETWNFEIKPRNTVFHLPGAGLSNFSFGRGATDFILLVDSKEKIKKIEVLGIKVNLTDYKIINRTDTNFFAIRNDFFQQIETQNLTEWKRFLKEIKNVD